MAIIYRKNYTIMYEKFKLLRTNKYTHMCTIFIYLYVHICVCVCGFINFMTHESGYITQSTYSKLLSHNTFTFFLIVCACTSSKNLSYVKEL